MSYNYREYLTTAIAIVVTHKVVQTYIALSTYAIYATIQ
jgi:hypothetical protein